MLLAKSLRSFTLAAAMTTALIGCGPTEPTANQVSSDASADAPPNAPYVAVTQIVEHPALDAVRDGIKDELAEAGYEDGSSLTWKWESAQGQPATATQIAQKFVGERPDLIVAIATPSAQAAVATSEDIPIVFSAVTDPVAAELVPSLDAPSALVTGVSDLSPIDQHLALIKEIIPTVATIGVVYNAGEANSVSLVDLIKAEAPGLELTVVEATVASSADVATAAESLIGKVDVIYVPTDNTVVSALESVLTVGADNQIPVFAGDTDSVERGAIAGISFDYYDVGRQTGDMVVRILNGEQPNEIPVETVETLQLAVNPAAAATMGVEIPAAVQSRADMVFE